MPPAKLGINLQTLVIFLINLRFPHLFLFTGLLMHGIGRLQSDTVVRALAVVELYEGLYLLLSLLKRLKTPVLTIYALTLDDAVHALCKGVVGGLVVLRHRDLYLVFLQFLHIEVTAVLYAPVRMVNKFWKFTSASLFYGHAEGFEGEYGCQRVCQAPTHDLLRVGISHEMQVAASANKVDVGDVALPQLVSRRRSESLDEVLPLMVAVVGVRRGTALARLLHEPVTTQQVQERIAPGHPARIEHHAEHLPELYPADARVKSADLLHGIKDADLACQPLRIVRLLLVKGLTATAKQLTGSSDGQAMLPVEFFYCLAPDFFRISMPLRSATSISVFRARFCNSSSRMRDSSNATSGDFSDSFFLRAISSIGWDSACKDTTFSDFL